MPAQQTKNHFDILRVLLASLVVFSHSFVLGSGSEALEPLAWLCKQAFGQVITLGELAVDGFFVISGYLIAMSWERSKSAGDYLRKRIGRIFPGFIVASAIGVYALPYFAVQADAWQHVGLGEFLAKVLLLKSAGHPQAFAANAYPGVTNGSLWSISYEFWCYIGVALLGTTGLLVQRRAVLALFGLALLVSYGFAASGWRPGGGLLGEIVGFPPFWARLLPYYLAGVLAYRYRDAIRYTPAGSALAVAATVALAPLEHSWSFVLPIAWAYVLLCLAFTSAFRPLAATRYGDCSYGAYLYAFPIQQSCVMAAGGSLPPMLLFSISLPLSLLVGLLSRHLVEKWFVRGRTARTRQGSGLAWVNR